MPTDHYDIIGSRPDEGSCTAHLRFGAGPRMSVLDLDCKAHEPDSLYVTDAGFSPPIGAVNPTLANTLRVADRIKERLGA